MARVVHSMRRTYYFFPKTVFGKPTDVFIDYTSRIPLPRKLMRLFYRWGMRIVVGPHHRFGLSGRITTCSRRIPPPATPISTISSMGAPS